MFALCSPISRRCNRSSRSTITTPRARLRELSVVRASNHAEGIGTIDHKGKTRLVVACDAPQETRKSATERRLAVDLFEIMAAS